MICFSSQDLLLQFESNDYFQEVVQICGYDILKMMSRSISNTVKMLEQITDDNDDDKIIVLSTYQSVPRLKQYIDVFDFVVLDESHNSMSATR